MNKVRQFVLLISLYTISTLTFPLSSYASDPTANCGGTGIESAVGCIPVSNTEEFTEFLLSWGIGIAGGIALLLIGYGGFQVITAGGNPQKVQAGKELITASLAGLLFIIFSAFLLRLVGIDILGITQLSI